VAAGVAGQVGKGDGRLAVRTACLGDLAGDADQPPEGGHVADSGGVLFE
jgi:hypothetical protein